MFIFWKPGRKQEDDMTVHSRKCEFLMVLVFVQWFLDCRNRSATNKQRNTLHQQSVLFCCARFMASTHVLPYCVVACVLAAGFFPPVIGGCFSGAKPVSESCLVPPASCLVYTTNLSCRWLSCSVRGIDPASEAPDECVKRICFSFLLFSSQKKGLWLCVPPG